MIYENKNLVEALKTVREHRGVCPNTVKKGKHERFLETLAIKYLDGGKSKRNSCNPSEIPKYLNIINVMFTGNVMKTLLLAISFKIKGIQTLSSLRSNCSGKDPVIPRNFIYQGFFRQESLCKAAGRNGFVLFGLQMASSFATSLPLHLLLLGKAEGTEDTQIPIIISWATSKYQQHNYRISQMPAYEKERAMHTYNKNPISVFQKIKNKPQ
ncbi:hypothetical protein E2320_008214, partial [Naja naja]